MIVCLDNMLDLRAAYVIASTMTRVNGTNNIIRWAPNGIRGVSNSLKGAPSDPVWTTSDPVKDLGTNFYPKIINEVTF